MKKSDILTIVIPVKDSPDVVASFIEANEVYLKKYKVVVIDSGGGAALKKYADVYVNEDLSMSDARRLGYASVGISFTFNLDVDTVIPKDFLKDSLLILKKNEDVVVVALDYESSQGHYAFGCSLWRTEILKKLYRYKKGKPECECIYMWHRVLLSGKKIETLPCRAIHLKET